MSPRPLFLRARAPLAIRLFGWMLVLAVCGLLLWIVFGGGRPRGARIGVRGRRSEGRGARHR